MEVRCYRKILHGRKWETKRERGVGDKDREIMEGVGGWVEGQRMVHAQPELVFDLVTCCDPSHKDLSIELQTAQA